MATWREIAQASQSAEPSAAVAEEEEATITQEDLEEEETLTVETQTGMLAVTHRWQPTNGELNLLLWSATLLLTEMHLPGEAAK